MKKKFESSVNIRVLARDRRVLSQTARKLSLDESETGRRALRLGLRFLQDVNLPGGEPREAESR